MKIICMWWQSCNGTRPSTMTLALSDNDETLILLEASVLKKDWNSVTLFLQYEKITRRDTMFEIKRTKLYGYTGLERHVNIRDWSSSHIKLTSWLINTPTTD